MPLPTLYGKHVVQMHEYYRCSGCGKEFYPKEVKSGELCPACDEQCELVHDCPACFRDMDADYDKQIWTCACCKIVKPMNHPKMG